MIVKMICVLIGIFYIGLMGRVVYVFYTDGPLMRGFVSVIATILGVVFLIGLLIHGLGFVISKFGNRFSEAQRLDFCQTVKWIMIIGLLTYVPWQGNHRYDDENIINLGYSFIGYPPSKNNFDTFMNGEWMFYTFIALLFTMHGLRITLFGKKNADLMASGKFVPGAASDDKEPPTTPPLTK